METHKIHAELLRRRVRVLVVGCGGTGSAVVGGLPFLHQALIAWGHPEGLHVTVMDGDVISPTNCVRQPFSRCEVGNLKSVVLVNRLNLFWNLGWEAVPEHLVRREPLDRVDVVIGCVDTRAARAVIRECTTRWSATSYWLDIGSTADAGQFILGEPLNQVNRRCRTRLRTVAELYPETVDGSFASLQPDFNLSELEARAIADPAGYGDRIRSAPLRILIEEGRNALKCRGESRHGEQLCLSQRTWGLRHILPGLPDGRLSPPSLST